MDPATAGTVGFLIRLTTVVIVVAVALRVAGLRTSTLAVGGAVTAVVVGLAAQQTLGNLLAGLVLLTNRPFRVGERVQVDQAGRSPDSWRAWSASSGSSTPRWSAGLTGSWCQTRWCSTWR